MERDQTQPLSCKDEGRSHKDQIQEELRKEHGMLLKTFVRHDKDLEWALE